MDRTQALLAAEGVRAARIDWRESVRKWHPGQDWVWEPGGFGVCDPGINAFSIFTKVMPFPVFVESAKLTFPANKQTPVDVEVAFKFGQAHKPKMSSGFNWLEENGEILDHPLRDGGGERDQARTGAAAPCGSMAKWCWSMATKSMPASTSALPRLLDDHRSEVDARAIAPDGRRILMGARENGPDFSW